MWILRITLNEEAQNRGHQYDPSIIQVSTRYTGTIYKIVKIFRYPYCGRKVQWIPVPLF
jgi:hypothetical protein